MPIAPHIGYVCLLADITQSSIHDEYWIYSCTETQENSCSEHEFDVLDPDIEEVPINAEELQILGEDPASNKPKEFKFHSGLASRWEACIRSGLNKENRAELLKTYSREGNCPLEAPILNAELLSSLNEMAVKRDRHFVDSQCLIGSALSALGTAITLLLNDKKESVDRNELLKLMCDVGKLITDLHQKESVARKAYILPGLDKRARTILGKVETDKFLFGEDLAEKLKSAKAIEKAGLDLKLQPMKAAAASKVPFKKNSVNWKGPPARVQRTNQVGNNQRGPRKGGRAQQENRLPEQTQLTDEKSSRK